MRQTNNFNLTIPEGSDNVNILTQITPNFETIDGVMKDNENAGVQVATVLYSNNIHAITRTKDDASVMRFTATSRFTLGDTFTVDGVQVTALAPTGEQLPDGAFIVGSEVLAILKGTLLTIFAGAKATDSAKLNGQNASYYATKAEVDNAKALAESATTIAQNALEKSTIDVIWDNQNVTTDFNSQDLILKKPLNSYKFIFVEFALQKNKLDTYSSELLPVGEYNTVTMPTFYNFFRVFDTRNNRIVVGDCNFYTSYGSDSTATGNAWMIPKKVYGVK